MATKTKARTRRVTRNQSAPAPGTQRARILELHGKGLRPVEIFERMLREWKPRPNRNTLWSSISRCLARWAG